MITLRLISSRLFMAGLLRRQASSGSLMLNIGIVSACAARRSGSLDAPDQQRILHPFNDTIRRP